MPSSFNYVDHGTMDGYCPRCGDDREFSVTEQVPPGVVGAFCEECGWATEALDVPDDAEEAEELHPGET